MSERTTPSGAVDSAVLFHLSKSGGLNTGPDLTRERLEAMSEGGMLTPAAVYKLMLDAAERAAAESQRRADGLRWEIYSRLAQLNDQIDSARLARYIESLEADSARLARYIESLEADSARLARYIESLEADA